MGSVPMVLPLVLCMQQGLSSAYFLLVQIHTVPKEQNLLETVHKGHLLVAGECS